MSSALTEEEEELDTLGTSNHIHKKS